MALPELSTGLSWITADPHLSHVKAIVVTTYELDEYVFAALRAGASGFSSSRTTCAKPSVRWPKGTCCRRRGDETADRGVLARRNAIRRMRARLALLTQREREIVALVGAVGLEQRRHRGEPGDQPVDGEDARVRAMIKVDARDRAQLVVFAYESGLVTPAIG